MEIFEVGLNTVITEDTNVYVQLTAGFEGEARGWGSSCCNSDRTLSTWEQLLLGK